MNHRNLEDRHRGDVVRDPSRLPAGDGRLISLAGFHLPVIGSRSESTTGSSTDADNLITLERACELLGLPETHALAFTRSCPPMLNTYSASEGTLLSEREVNLLREALLTELESYFESHPGHLIRVLGSKPFIDAYHEQSGKAR